MTGGKNMSKEKTREEQAIASLKWILFNVGEDTKPNTFENAVCVYVKNAISIIEEKGKSAKIAHLLNEKGIDIHLLKTCESEDEYNEIQMKRYGSYALTLYLSEEEFKEAKNFFLQIK